VLEWGGRIIWIKDAVVEAELPFAMEVIGTS
jgi:hypothetical protein